MVSEQGVECLSWWGTLGAMGRCFLQCQVGLCLMPTVKHQQGNHALSPLKAHWDLCRSLFYVTAAGCVCFYKMLATCHPFSHPWGDHSGQKILAPERWKENQEIINDSSV